MVPRSQLIYYSNCRFEVIVESSDGTVVVRAVAGLRDVDPRPGIVFALHGYVGSTPLPIVSAQFKLTPDQSAQIFGTRVAESQNASAHFRFRNLGDDFEIGYADRPFLGSNTFGLSGVSGEGKISGGGMIGTIELLTDR